MEEIKTELVVLGAGPGGYTAAFYAADLGKKVILVDQEKRLGGVCLNRGCIPSKAFLHATAQIREAKLSENRGIRFGPAAIDCNKLRLWKESILEKLGGGIRMLAQKRQVEVITGRGYFEDSNSLRVETPDGQRIIRYEKAILAVGSVPAVPKAFDLGNKLIMTSTEALEMETVPENLLVIGAGYIGMELGTVYALLGSHVVVAEALETMLTGADSDLVRPVARFAEKHFKEIRLKAKVLKMATVGKQIKVEMEYGGKKLEELYDRVLIAVGRMPNRHDLGLENTKISYDQKGFVKVGAGQQTDDPAIYAIGDIAGGLLLAHKASKEARLAVEHICGKLSEASKSPIPTVVFTEPEIAWCGITEDQAKQNGLNVKVSRFSWMASGRALSSDRADGLTKLIIDAETERILGVGIVGIGAGELISEGALAINLSATAYDLAQTVHPHPTLSETLMEAAEAFYGQSTHLFSQKKS